MDSPAEVETAVQPDLFVGTTLGVLKGVSLSSGSVVNYYSANRSLEEVHKSECVCAVCWEHQCSDGLLYCGLKNGVVQQFDTRKGIFQAECDCTGGSEMGTFVGIGKHEDVLITCTDSGNLAYWPAATDKVAISVGGGVSCMTANPSVMLQVATGGKENELKLWDGSRPEAPVFQAKNVKSDKLDLRVPVWVTGIGFVPGSGEQPTMAVATGYHQVRLYDTRAQRRPVYSQEYGEHPFYALTTTQDGRYFVVGNSIGEIMRIDVRTGKVVGRYIGCRGSVKDLVSYTHEEKLYLASVSLDRFLRVYSMENPKLLHKVYLKLQPTCVLYNDAALKASECIEEKEVEAESTITTGSNGNMEEKEVGGGTCDDDDVWRDMDTIPDRPLKRKTKTKVSNNDVKKRRLKHSAQ